MQNITDQSGIYSIVYTWLGANFLETINTDSLSASGFFLLGMQVQSPPKFCIEILFMMTSLRRETVGLVTLLLISDLTGTVKLIEILGWAPGEL